MTPSGIELATFRLVTQCLKQLRYGVPLGHLSGSTLFSFMYGLNFYIECRLILVFREFTIRINPSCLAG